MMEVDYCGYLPPVFKKIKEMQSVGKGIDFTFSEIWEKLDAIFDNQFIDSLDKYGCERWEKILSLKPSAISTLEERQTAIASRVAMRLPYDITAFHDMIYSLTGSDAEVNVDGGRFHVDILLPLKSRSYVDVINNLCEKVLPANMLYDIEVAWRTHGSFTDYTHANLMSYRCEELRFFESEVE